MPVWHKLTRQARKDDNLVVVGIIQEQHAERCRLFAQWKQLDFPIVQDPFNLVGIRVVPVPVALDEAGNVVSKRMRTSELQKFLKRKPVPSSPAQAAERPNLVKLGKAACCGADADTYKRSADSLILFGTDKQVNVAVNNYKMALSDSRPDIRFRYGVALRKRFDSKFRQSGDFQEAVNAWTTALRQDPNQYIYRRRIEQYGPRLIKPYPFYDWVKTARAEITDRGETPVQLSVEPSGAEIAQPMRQAEFQSKVVENPDPENRITRDEKLIDSEVIIVPGKVRPGDTVRIHVRMKPINGSKWNNESGPTKLWVNLPEGWKSDSQLLISGEQTKAESTEERQFEFELKTPKSAVGISKLSGFALYHVCESQDGQCVYRRRDFEFKILYRLSSKS